jgi:hypothetical protein
MKSLSLSATFLVALIPFHLVAAGQLNLPVQKLLPPGGTNLWFGNDVDVDGAHLVVSSPTTANSGGKAYLYELGAAGWEYQTALASPALHDPNYFYFGQNAAVSAASGSSPARVMVSSDGGGRLFEKSGANWNEIALLPGYGDVAGDIAISTISGTSARVFHFQGGAWNAGAALSPTFPDGGSLDGSFGEEIVFDGAHVFVSAHSQDHLSTINSGAVFVYQQVGDQLINTKTLVPPDPTWRGQFGYGIDADDGTLLVGRPGGSPSAAGPVQGIAYVYENLGNDWSETTRLQASDGFPGDSFGAKVAISGNLAAVSSWSAADGGRVYLFRRDLAGWNELGWLKTGAPFPEDQFGLSLKLDGRHLVIGARLDSQIGSDAGAVYVYTVPEPAAGVLSAIAVAAITLSIRQRRHFAAT